MKENREPEAFTFFESFGKAIGKVPDKLARMQLNDAFVCYGQYGIEPQFIKHHVDDDGVEYISPNCPLWMAEAIFEGNRHNIDVSREKHRNGSKGAEHGDKGGRCRNGEDKNDAYIRRNGIDAFVASRLRQGVSAEEIDAAIEQATRKAQDPNDRYEFEYEPTQVPDDGYDYMVESYIPPFPSALDIDISQDLVA